jgi:hypothetical protein
MSHLAFFLQHYKVIVTHLVNQWKICSQKKELLLQRGERDELGSVVRPDIPRAATAASLNAAAQLWPPRAAYLRRDENS